MKALHKAVLIGAVYALYSTTASAQLTNQGMLDQVVMGFATRATAWQTVVMDAAMYLFWTLGTISLVITFGFMALRKADIGDFSPCSSASSYGCCVTAQISPTRSSSLYRGSASRLPGCHRSRHQESSMLAS